MIASLRILYYESKANKLRPLIIKYLHGEKEYWMNKLFDFRDNDEVTRSAFSEDEIIKRIEDTENDLNFDNTYQLLKAKYMNDKKMLADLASGYHTFLVCIESFRKTKSTDAPNSAYDCMARQVEGKKMKVYQHFQALLGHSQGTLGGT